MVHGLFVPWTVHTVLGLFVSWTIRTITGRCWERRHSLYSASQTPPPWGFLIFFSKKRLGIFSPNFTHLFYVPTYSRLQIFIQLEVHGRARREAARRRKSEWKVNLDIRNSSRSNGSWRMRNSILEPRGVWICVNLQCTCNSGKSIWAL